MRLLVVALLGSFLGILGIAGCSSGGGSTPACSTTFTPCGGDPTGTWTYVTECNPLGASAICPQATSNISVNLSGTYTFNADKTFSINATAADTGTLTIPASCLNNIPCSELNQDSTTDGITIKETCTGTTTCDCTISISGTLNQTGTWAVAGNDIVTTANGGTASMPQSYCVKGSELDLAGGMMGTMSAGAYTLFTQ